MKGLGIKYQLRLTALIPVLFVALMFAIFYNHQYRVDLNQRVARLGESYVRQLLPAAQLALTRNDKRLLQGLIDSSTINPEIIALAFYNADGQLIAYRGGKQNKKRPIKPQNYTGDYVEISQLEPHAFNFIAPITIPKFNLYGLGKEPPNTDTSPQPDDLLGWVSIDLATQSMIIKRYQMYIVTIFITLFGLLISLSIHYFLSNRIYVPLARLRRSMQQILSNEFETRISTSSKGELGTIEKGCAHLQKQYLSTVKELNHHIEVATEDLQQSLELLEEKNIDLSMEKKKAEEKSRQKSEFIANMSHEIRTPMNGVIGFTNVLLESKLDPLQLDYVKTIKSSAQDLLTIINDILDYSKMDAGKLVLDCIPVDLRACVDEVLMLTSPNANKKGIDLIPSTQPNVPKTVLGDPLRIKQIITNLISNAIKFTDKGHVLVTTRIEEESEKEYLISIAVTDTGIGIDPRDQVKLFNAFNQADTSIARRFGGSGLGLAICKMLVEKMKGRINLTSEINQGSTFTASFRLEKLTAFESDKASVKATAKLKAICYSESALHMEAMCNGLLFCGVECYQVKSLKALKNAFKTQIQSNMAFINLNPGQEEQVAEIISQQTIPCVLVSKTMIHNPQSLGAHSFLYQPISIQKLQETINQLLNQSTQSQSACEQDIEIHTLRNRLRRLNPEILIAEDNPVNRMLLNSFLGTLATLDMAHDGKEAFNLCQSKTYQIILLDLKMPEMTGLEVAHKIREQSLINSLTPVIIISADESELANDKLKEANVSLWLKKPVDERQLLGALLDFIENTKPQAIDWALCIQKVSGNQQLAEEFLIRFVEELKQNREEFLQFQEARDIKGIENTAHKLHGACCFCGVPYLQSSVAQLEQIARRAENMQQLEVAFKQLLHSIDEVLQAFKKTAIAFRHSTHQADK